MAALPQRFASGPSAVKAANALRRMQAARDAFRFGKAERGQSKVTLRDITFPNIKIMFLLKIKGSVRASVVRTGNNPFQNWATISSVLIFVSCRAQAFQVTHRPGPLDIKGGEEPIAIRIIRSPANQRRDPRLILRCGIFKLDFDQLPPVMGLGGNLFNRKPRRRRPDRQCRRESKIGPKS